MSLPPSSVGEGIGHLDRSFLSLAPVFLLALVVAYAVYGWMLYVVGGWMLSIGDFVEDAYGEVAMFLLFGMWVVLVVSLFVAAVVDGR